MDMKNPIRWLSEINNRLNFRPLTYGYSNARVRTMRTALLTRRQAEDLLAVQNNAGVVDYLSKTAYREDFAHLLPNMTAEERLEIATGRNFARTIRKLLIITPAQSRPTLAAFLGRYDVHNLKTIMLAKKVGRGADATRHMLIAAGEISAQEIEEMLAAKGTEELYDAIRKSKFGSRFLSSASIKHLPKAKVKAALLHPESEDARLDLLLSALDEYYYEVVSAAVVGGEKDAGVIAGLLQIETDAKNMITAMRLKRGGAKEGDIMDSFVAGGSFSQQQLHKIAKAKDVEEIVRVSSHLFKSKQGKEAMSSAEKKYSETELISHFEIAFENRIARHSVQALRRSTLSIGTIIGFLLLKEEEVNNIRKIVRGKALGLHAQAISEMLVFAD